MSLLSRLSLTNLRHVEPREKSQAVKDIIQDSAPRDEFYVMMVLSTSIAVLALITDSTPALIGSMVIAPLLYPVIGIGLALSMKNWQLLLRALKLLIISTGISLTAAILVAVFFNYEYDANTKVLLDSLEASNIGLAIAIASALAASIGFAKKSIDNIIAGIAIAVALIPPLASIGIGIARQETATVISATSQYLLNVFAIALTSFVVFWWMNFKTEEHRAEKTAHQEDRKQRKEERHAEKEAEQS